jgi:hypothetical protein
MDKEPVYHYFIVDGGWAFTKTPVTEAVWRSLWKPLEHSLEPTKKLLTQNGFELVSLRPRITYEAVTHLPVSDPEAPSAS